MSEPQIAHYVRVLERGPATRFEWREAVRGLGTLWPRLRHQPEVAARWRARLLRVLDLELMAEDVMIRWDAVRAMERVGGPGAVTAVRLAQLLDHDEQWLVGRVIRAIGRTDPDAVRDRLLDFLRELRLSRDAAEALGELRHPDHEVVRALVAALGKGTWDGRWAAAAARASLGRLSAKNQDIRDLAASEVGPLLGHAREQLRMDAVRTLAAIEAPSWQRRCLEALRDPAPHVRWAALAALIRAGQETEAIVAAAADPNPGVRAGLADLLIRSRLVIAGQLIEQLCLDPHPDVRIRALDAARARFHREVTQG
ncbi:HEAT repeat domain-containing protein [Nonomuraea sp. NPDC050556]|uniref:HEAT repeat domain-containing protein n=1 Tax=Nonomuraea sp. NPDC050556 TaxID=3364369 RepID=UPI0037A3F237